MTAPSRAASSEGVERGKETLEHPAREARREAEQGRGWYAGSARLGLVAKGVSFVIVGILAIELAFGHGGKAASREGALATLADEAFGKTLLVVLAFGFAAYAIWRFVEAFAEREDDEEKATGKAKKWGKRAGYIGRGLIYAALAVGSARLLVDATSHESQTETAQKSTATVLDWPAGRWLVGLVGLAIIGAGVWNLYRALTKKFEDKWRSGEMSVVERKWGGRIGIAGHLARAVVFTLIGLFITKAAVEYDPKEAIGFDGALQKLASQAYGPHLLGLTAAGLICYGLYCLVDARYRDVSVGPG